MPLPRLAKRERAATAAHSAPPTLELLKNERFAFARRGRLMYRWLHKGLNRSEITPPNDRLFLQRVERSRRARGARRRRGAAHDGASLTKAVSAAAPSAAAARAPSAASLMRPLPRPVPVAPAAGTAVEELLITNTCGRDLLSRPASYGHRQWAVANRF